MLVTLSLKNPPHLGELHAQPSRDVLGLQPLGHRDSKICLEGANHLMHLITLSDDLVALLADRAMLRAESFCGLMILVLLPM